MKWQIESDRPVYRQLMEQLEHAVIAGSYEPGDKLPSVRDLASEAGVNPNTMQKALAELERSGLLYSQRTSGRFITEDKQMIDDLKYTMAREEALAFLEKMKALGLSLNDLIQLLKGLEEKDAAKM